MVIEISAIGLNISFAAGSFRVYLLERLIYVLLDSGLVCRCVQDCFVIAPVFSVKEM